MRQRELDDILTEERSMNPRKTVDYWGDGGRDKDYIAWKLFKNKLEGSVGKKWDKVYGKLKKELKPRLHHWMENYVEEAPMIIGKTVYDSAGRYELGSWRGQLYVDRQGFLRKAQPTKRKREPKRPGYIFYDNRVFTTVEEIWYELYFEFFEKVKRHNIYEYYSWIHGCVHKADHSYANCLINGHVGKSQCWKDVKGVPVVCTKTLQCGKRTVKQLNKLFEKNPNGKPLSYRS